VRRLAFILLVLIGSLYCCGETALHVGASAPTGPPTPEPAPQVASYAVTATTCLTHRLTADKTAVEVTGLPTGTAKIHFAVGKDTNMTGIVYGDRVPTALTYTPPADHPVVDEVALNSSGGIINACKWAGRLPTVPGGETPPPSPPPPPPPPPSSPLQIGVDIGGWGGSGFYDDMKGAARYVRSNATHYGSDTSMGQLASRGLHLIPLFFESKCMTELDNSTSVSTVVNWVNRYAKGGTYWAGKTDLGADYIELVNEPGNPYLHGCEPRGEGQKRAYIDLANKTAGALNGKVRVLVSYDGGYEGDQYGEWLLSHGLTRTNVGITLHPYGGTSDRAKSALGGRSRVEKAIPSGLPIYVTEVGWPTCGRTGDSENWSEQEQATNITTWINWVRGLSSVKLTTNFNAVDYSGNCYGLDRSSSTPWTQHKPAYFALKAASGL